MTQPWVVRAATDDDTESLAAFDCVGPEAPRWEQEVQDFVRDQLLRWAVDPCAQENDPRILLVLAATTGELVGIGAHERVTLQDSVSGERFAATKIEVIAVARAWQGQSFDAEEGVGVGPRASDILMSALMTDIASRVPPRDARVLAVVHQDNLRSLALCHRYGLTEELSRPDPAYRRLVTASDIGRGDG